MEKKNIEDSMKLPHYRHRTLPDNPSTKTSNQFPPSLSLKDPSSSMLLTQQNANRIPINDYLSIIKTKTKGKWDSEAGQGFPRPWLQKLQKPKVEANQKQMMSQIVAKRRCVKVSNGHRDVDMFRKNKLTEVVEAIVGCYEYYEKFGYSASKITSIVKLFCKQKSDLQWILLRKNKSEINPSEYSYSHRAKPVEILNRLLRTILNKVDHQKLHVIREITNFKSKLEEDVLDKGRDRVKEIRDSITHQKKELTSKVAQIEENCPNIRSSKIYHRSLPEEELELVANVGQFANTFTCQSTVNRLLYKHFTSLLKYH